MIQLDRFLVTLRMTGSCCFRSYHGVVIMGLLRAALGKHLLRDVIPCPIESELRRFEPGETYRFGVTLLGEAQALAGELRTGLDHLGASTPAPGRPLPALRGNFRVEHFDLLPIPDLAAQVVGLIPSAADVPLRLLTPLCLERPRPQRRDLGAAHPEWSPDRVRFFPLGELPPAILLARLWDRLFELETGRKPTDNDRAAGRPPIPAEAVVRPQQVEWVKIEKVEGGGRSFVLGGERGTALLVGAGPAWLPWLVRGQWVHLGNGAHYGCGAFRLPGAPSLVAGQPGSVACGDALATPVPQ